MTLHQLMVLIDRDRLATGSSHPPAEPEQMPGATSFGPLGMAAMGLI